MKTFKAIFFLAKSIKELSISYKKCTHIVWYNVFVNCAWKYCPRDDINAYSDLKFWHVLHSSLGKEIASLECLEFLHSSKWKCKEYYSSNENALMSIDNLTLNDSRSHYKTSLQIKRVPNKTKILGVSRSKIHYYWNLEP